MSFTAQNATNSTLQDQPDNNSIIIGAACGGAAIVGIIVTVIIIIIVRRKKKAQENTKSGDHAAEKVANDNAYTIINLNPEVKEPPKPVENDAPEDNPLKQDKKNLSERDNDAGPFNCELSDVNKKKDLCETNNISSNRGFLQDLSATIEKQPEIALKTDKPRIEKEHNMNIREEVQNVPSVQNNVHPPRFNKFKKGICSSEGTDQRSIPDDDYYKHKFEAIRKEIKDQADERKLFDKDEAEIENKIKMAFENKEKKSEDEIERIDESNENEISKEGNFK